MLVVGLESAAGREKTVYLVITFVTFLFDF